MIIDEKKFNPIKEQDLDRVGRLARPQSADEKNQFGQEIIKLSHENFV